MLVYWKYLHKAQKSESQKDIDGVNKFQFIPADVMKFLVPIQHCPMGLVGKLLTSFLDYAWQNKSFFYRWKMTWYRKNFKRWMSNSHLWSTYFSERKLFKRNPKH